MSGDRLPSIDKLNSTNWPVWKMQLTNYLLARELWDLCDGNDPAPVLTADETPGAFAVRQKQYTVKKARVMSIFGQTISTQFLYLITSHDVTTPQQAWNALLGHFERQSLSNRMALKCQLFGFKMEAGATMDSHIKNLNELVERLASLNAPVDEQDQVVLLLRSLPSQYESIYTAYVAKGQVGMGELREALVNHERRLTGDEPSGVSDFALASRSRVRKVPPGKDVTCFECGEKGHYARDCTTPKCSVSTCPHCHSNKKVQSGNWSDENDDFHKGAF